MAKDRIGNELEIHNLVSMMVQSQRNANVLAEVFGRIVSIQEGGIVTPAGQRGQQKQDIVTPGVVTVMFEMDVVYDPRQKVAHELLKLVDPARKPEIVQ